MLYLVSSTSHTTTILHAIIVIITAIIITQLLLSRLCNFPGLHLDLQRYNSSITRIAIDGSRKRRYRHRGVWFREWGNGWEAYQFIVDTHWPTTRRRLGLSARRQEPCPPVASCLRARNALHDQASSPLRQISPHLSDEEVLLSQTCAHTVRSAFTLIHQRERGGGGARAGQRPRVEGCLACPWLEPPNTERERERERRPPPPCQRRLHDSAQIRPLTSSRRPPTSSRCPQPPRGCVPDEGATTVHASAGSRVSSRGRWTVVEALSRSTAGAGKRERRRWWDLDLGGALDRECGRREEGAAAAVRFGFGGAVDTCARRGQTLGSKGKLLLFYS
jgi:hypothetical protein